MSDFTKDDLDDLGETNEYTISTLCAFIVAEGTCPDCLEPLTEKQMTSGEITFDYYECSGCGGKWMLFAYKLDFEKWQKMASVLALEKEGN